jgi:hypothetical protein
MKSSHIFLHKEPDAYCNQFKNMTFVHMNHIYQTKNIACFYVSISKNDFYFLLSNFHSLI